MTDAAQIIAFGRRVRRSWHFGAWAAICSMASFALAGEASDVRKVDLPAASELEWQDVRGAAQHPLRDVGQRATLLIFLLHDCPVANSYAPEIKRICTEFLAAGISCHLVYAEAGLRKEDAAKHAADYFGGCAPALFDPQGKLATLTGATRVPEAVVLSPWGEVLYRGRIDDRFKEIGKAALQPDRSDLRDALTAIVAGKPVAIASTEVVGCDLTFPKPAESAPPPSQTPTPAEPVTFHQHIAPILREHCAACHQPGEIGPFSLLQYEDARKRSRLMAEITGKEIMPPWHASPASPEFSNDRRLSSSQKAQIQAWHAAGAPEGNPGASTSATSAPAGRNGFLLRLEKPDVSVTCSEKFSVPAEGPDFYHTFSFPLPNTEERWASAIEIRPTARRSVHHVLLFLEYTPAPGATAPASAGSAPIKRLRAGKVQQFISAWAPGGGVVALPPDLAVHLPPGAKITAQTHFHPNGKAEEEQMTLRLRYAAGPPQRTWITVQVPPAFGVLSGLCIPPGDPAWTLRDSFVLPVDADTFGVGGHSHFLARRMRLTATLPGGDTRLLLRIDDWDFAWQEQYHYRNRIPLPAGTRIDAEIIFDNSPGNLRNPSRPPKEIRWGNQSTDEMGSLTLAVIPKRNEEVAVIRSALLEHMADLIIDLVIKHGDKLPHDIPRDLQTGLALLRAGIPTYDADRDGLLNDTERKKLRDAVVASGAPDQILRSNP